MSSIVPIGEFKTHCYQILSQAQEKNQEFVITRKGKPIAKIFPINAEKSDSDEEFFDCLKDVAEIKGDIISSLDLEWDVYKEGSKKQDE